MYKDDTRKMNSKNARIIGIITVLSYVANYFLRNILGVLTPAILNDTSYTKEYIALLSSAYMISYAVGQLLNGVLGDVLKPKMMVLSGLLVAGASAILFPVVQYSTLQIACFIVLGYCLSMLRGPLMKIITENTKPDHARIICVFFSFSSFAGPLIASLMAMLFKWKQAFVVAGVLTVFVGIFAYLSLSAMENKGLLSIKRIEKITASELLGVFKIEGISFYLIIASLQEAWGTSMIFWTPTFLNEYISLDENMSNFVFSFMSLVSAIVPFVALAVYKLSKERDILILKGAFIISLIAVAGILVAPKGIFTMMLLLVSRIMNSFVSAILWSIYIPGLGKTGRVSSINGIMDCLGYISAGIITSVCAYVMNIFGWNGIIVLWAILSLTGAVAAIPYSGKINAAKASE